MESQAKTPEELQADLGEAMRSLRVAKRMKQADVATKGGLSLKAVASLERGEGSSVETLVRVLNAVGAADAIAKLAPAPGISPLAMLRHASRQPQRVRDRAQPA